MELMLAGIESCGNYFLVLFPTVSVSGFQSMADASELSNLEYAISIALDMERSRA